MGVTRRLVLAARARREHASGQRPESRAPQSAAEILAKVLALKIFTWSYKHEPSSITRLGPMAQDFHQAFGYGAEDTRIPTESALGVCLVSIQVLACRVEALEAAQAAAPAGAESAEAAPRTTTCCR